MKIKDYMSGNVYSVKPETNVKEAVRIMQEQSIGCVPVCDNQNQVCGILTDRDILLRTVANNKDVNTTKASDVMTTNVYTCNQDDELEQAETKMSTYQVRRLPICDDNNKLVGMLTIGDIAQNYDEIGLDSAFRTLNHICDYDRNNNNA